MSKDIVRVDVTASPDLMQLAEELEKSGVGCLLVRGDEEVALMTPARPKTTQSPGRATSRRDPGRILNIIGLGSSKEPSNIARHKDEYIADAVDHRRR